MSFKKKEYFFPKFYYIYTFLSVAEKEKPSEIALKNLYSVAMILHPPMLSIVYYYP